MKDERIMPDHEDLEETIRISAEIMFETFGVKGLFIGV